LPDAVAVRLLAPAELDAVIEDLTARPPDKHRERLAQQARGELLYFIAWAGERAVGTALLRWRGRAGYPQLEDLWVLPELRGGGIGGALLDAVEDAAGEERADRVGLAVAMENAGARRLYRRRGYLPTEQPPFLLTYTAWGDDGIPRPVNELSLYLAKRL
jgi:ribosomal protein S18 acetylase RimI-like enzyme